MARLDIAPRTARAASAYPMPFDGPVMRAARLDALYGDASAEEIVEAALDTFGRGLTLVSSFGADAAVLLHIVSRIDPGLCVVFLETGRHFPETLAYVQTLREAFGLRRVVLRQPDADLCEAEDEDARLHARNPDRCCEIRKVAPLAEALEGASAWLTGRRRDQTPERRFMPVFEPDGSRIKINPLGNWSRADIRAYAARHALPAHPLVARGYPSVGCRPCTQAVAPGADPRAGRWRGAAKTECGIHLRPGT
ncbi:MAG: phosphoadenylyl-sulfate reductase [Pseudomonadota bacterium]